MTHYVIEQWTLSVRENVTSLRTLRDDLNIFSLFTLSISSVVHEANVKGPDASNRFLSVKCKQ